MNKTETILHYAKELEYLQDLKSKEKEAVLIFDMESGKYLVVSEEYGSQLVAKEEALLIEFKIPKIEEFIHENIERLYKNLFKPL